MNGSSRSRLATGSRLSPSIRKCIAEHTFPIGFVTVTDPPDVTALLRIYNHSWVLRGKRYRLTIKLGTALYPSGKGKARTAFCVGSNPPGAFNPNSLRRNRKCLYVGSFLFSEFWQR